MMVERFPKLWTERTRSLFEETAALDPSRQIAIVEMTDPDLLQASAGAAVTTDAFRNEVIHLDPDRLSEYAFAHEISHLYLTRAGWPKLFSFFNLDPLARAVADGIDNVFDHTIFHPRLELKGFDISSQHDNFLAGFDTWIKSNGNPAQTFDRAICICEMILAGGDHARKAISIAKKRDQSALALARRIASCFPNEVTPSTVREGFIKAIDLVNRWIEKELKAPQHLRWRIGITPSFVVEELEQPFLDLVEPISRRYNISNRNLACTHYVLRKDNTRFKALVHISGRIEEPALEPFKEAWQSRTVRQVLDDYNLAKVDYLTIR